MSLSRITSLAVPLAALVAACAPASTSAPHPSHAGTRTANVAVRNDSGQDMVIFALSTSGTRTRIGTVMRTSRSDLSIPESVLSTWDVRLIAVPIGGGAARTFSCPMKIRPGFGLQLVMDQNPILWSCKKA